MSKRTKKESNVIGGVGAFIEHGPALENLHKYLSIEELQKRNKISKAAGQNTPPDCGDKCDCDSPPHNLVNERKWKACEGACSSVCPKRIQDEFVQLLGQWDEQQQMGDLVNPATWSRLKRLVELGADINSFDLSEISFLHAAISTRTHDGKCHRFPHHHFFIILKRLLI